MAVISELFCRVGIMALIYGTQSERIGLYGYQHAQSTNPSHQTPTLASRKTQKKVGQEPIAPIASLNARFKKKERS
jgi:hypothetical protein